MLVVPIGLMFYFIEQYTVAVIISFSALAFVTIAGLIIISLPPPHMPSYVAHHP
jgi:hypothetical protein